MVRDIFPAKVIPLHGITSQGKFRRVAQKPAGADFCLRAKLDGDSAPHTLGCIF